MRTPGAALGSLVQKKKKPKPAKEFFKELTFTINGSRAHSNQKCCSARAGQVTRILISVTWSTFTRTLLEKSFKNKPVFATHYEKQLN